MELFKKILGGVAVASIVALGVLGSLGGEVVDVTPLVNLGVALGGAIAAVVALFLKKQA